MDPRLIAGLILSPFVVAFIYAGVHEYRRYKSEGPSDYGLVYDEKTGTSHVSTLADADDGYDPEDYDPNQFNDPEVSADRTGEDTGYAGEDDSTKT